MRKIIVAISALTIGMLGVSAPAHAAGFGDGKAATPAKQKNVCKALKGATKVSCVELAALPDWWMPIVGGGNVHRPNGVVIIKSIKGKNPTSEYKGLFDHNIKLYKDNHAHIMA